MSHAIMTKSILAALSHDTQVQVILAKEPQDLIIIAHQ